jgi:hypothetical protein
MASKAHCGDDDGGKLNGDVVKVEVPAVTFFRGAVLPALAIPCGRCDALRLEEFLRR